VYEKWQGDKRVYDRWAVTVGTKYGMKGLARSTALTKYTTIHLPSETLDAVSFLVHAPEVVSPYKTKIRDSKKTRELKKMLTPMKVENTPLFVHIWGVVRLRSTVCRGRIRGIRLLSEFLPFLPAPFVALASAFLGPSTPLGFLPVFLSYNPFSVNPKRVHKSILSRKKRKYDTAPIDTPNLPPLCPTNDCLCSGFPAKRVNQVFRSVIAT
jgi:hypothetical protein